MEIKSVESDSNIRPAKVINQMRKWDYTSKGRTREHFSSVSRSWKRTTSIPTSNSSGGCQQLFQEDVLICRENRRNWQTWNDFVTHFKSTFLPQVDAYQLLDVHDNKNWGSRMSSIALTVLMGRISITSKSQQFEYSYRNMYHSY